MKEAQTLLDEIRAKLKKLSRGNRELLFALRRKIYKELTYDERSKPMIRRKLKEQKRKEQKGFCAVCGKRLPEKYVVLDRLKAVDGYTKKNTRLICQECDVKVQSSRGYA
ncbi:MAG: hypothetical protein HY274_09570 [Gammaproteobacteria bacterium]|nr:hypothetical protein [Gammaproteobacteria bacterium]